MSKEEMISEIEIYLSHVVAKDFPLPKAIRLMYEEYKNSNKAWEEIYDEDQNYIGELNDKIFDLKFEVKNLQKEIEELEEENKELENQQNRINYLEDLISTMEEYYSITVEDLENCIRNDK